MRRTDDVFVGRRDELAFLQGELERARLGHPAFVVVGGPPGIGKTALVRRIADSDGVRAVRVTCAESERMLAFGVLDQLKQAAHPEAMRSTQESPADPLVAGAQFLDVLGGLQSEGPVVIVIDDAQWADDPSLRALSFAVRRLRADRVLFVTCLHDPEDPALSSDWRSLMSSEVVVRIDLGGLDSGEIALLGSAMGVTSLSSRATSQLQKHTGGHPSHTRAMLEEFSVEALERFELSLPAPHHYSLLVLSRLGRCSQEAQGLAVASAVLGQRARATTAARLAGLQDYLQALEEAAEAGLLMLVDEVADRWIAFPSALTRAAIYQDIGLARRSEMHSRAAELLEGTVSLYHRAAAASEEDPGLAEEFAAQAGLEADRGFISVAAGYMFEAARFCPAGPMRDRYLLDGVRLTLVNGDVREALHRVPEIEEQPDGPRKHLAFGHLAFLTGRFLEAEESLGRAWGSVDPGADPELASGIAAVMAQLCTLRGRGAGAAGWAMRSLATGTQPYGLGAAAVSAMVAGLTIRGRADQARRALAWLPADPARAAPEDLDALAARGRLKLWTDDLEGASADLQTVATSTQTHHPQRLGAIFCLADAEYRLGDWDAAVTHGDLAVSLAEDTDQFWSGTLAHAIASLVYSARGEWDEAEAHVRMATTRTQLMRDEASCSYACLAAASLASARSDHDGVLDAVEPVLEIERRWVVYEPGIVPWRPIFIEALIASDRLDEAEEALLAYEAVAAERGRRSAVAKAKRARGRLHAARGDCEAAHAAFEAALNHGDIVGPFELALSEDAYGRFLRREGRRREAADKLSSALERFSALGAKPFEEDAAREARACGLRPAKRGTGGSIRLTPQELAVTRLVASGKTNREVAAELVVSVKTIEYHLGNAYAKLGITSRSQLAGRFGDQSRDVESTPAP